MANLDAMAGALSYINAGKEHLTKGAPDLALGFFLEALKILPSSADAHINAALAYFEIKQFNKSLISTQQAIQLQPFDLNIAIPAMKILRSLGQQHLSLQLGYRYLGHKGSNQALMEELSSLRGISAMSSILEQSNQPYIEQELKDRFGLINYCIERFSFKKYLEIGCHDNETFDQIQCAYKVGVDPMQGGTMRLSSDEFFALSRDSFDLIFIDGLHHCEQVYSDIKNSLLHLNQNGLILIHDCMPLEEKHQMREPVDYVWNGDSWKAFVLFRQEQHLNAVTAAFDHGVGIIKVEPNSEAISLGTPYQSLSWEDLQKNKDKWLRPRSAQELRNWL